MPNSIISVEFRLHPDYGVILLPLHVGNPGRILTMLLNPSVPISGITTSLWDELLLQEYLLPQSIPSQSLARRHFLHDITLAAQPLPHLRVRRIIRPNIFNVDGELGVNFFQQFTEIHLQLSSRLITLIDP